MRNWNELSRRAHDGKCVRLYGDVVVVVVVVWLMVFVVVVVVVVYFVCVCVCVCCSYPSTKNVACDEVFVCVPMIGNNNIHRCVHTYTLYQATDICTRCRSKNEKERERNETIY